MLYHSIFTQFCREVVYIVNTISIQTQSAGKCSSTPAKHPRHVFTKSPEHRYSMLIHQAPPMTPTTTKRDNMPAPARSAVVIGLVMVSDVVVGGEVLPALGLLTEVPAVLFVNGT